MKQDYQFKNHLNLVQCFVDASVVYKTVPEFH